MCVEVPEGAVLKEQRQQALTLSIEHTTLSPEEISQHRCVGVCVGGRMCVGVCITVCGRMCDSVCIIIIYNYT